MPRVDHTQLIAALSYLTIAVFLSAGVATARYRAGLRRAAIVLFAVAMGLALALVAVWLVGRPVSAWRKPLLTIIFRGRRVMIVDILVVF